MEAMRQGGLDLPPLGGEGQIVETDETYFGRVDIPTATKKSTSHRRRKDPGTKNKRPIVTLVERGGRVRSFHVPVADKKTVQKIVK